MVSYLAVANRINQLIDILKALSHTSSVCSVTPEPGQAGLPLSFIQLAPQLMVLGVVRVTGHEYI